MPSTLSQSLPLRLLHLLLGLCLTLVSGVFVLILGSALLGNGVNVQLGGQPVTHPSPLLLLGLTAMFLLVLGLISTLYRVIGRARRGHVFSLANVRDLRLLGIASLVWWTLPLWQMLFSRGETKLEFGWNATELFSSPLTLGLVFLSFGEVLREGLRLRESEQRLREEQDLTV